MASAEDDQELDRALVQSFLRHRGEASFRLLYRRHTPGMLRLGQRISSSSGVAAEDAVQEAWVRAARLLPQFAWRSSLRSWLGGIVVNVVRELRRAARPGGLDSDMAANDADFTADAWLDPVDRIALAEALRDLPEGYRTVVALHDIAGFTHSEIAAILGIDVGTSKSQLARARQRLRDHFTDHDEGGER